MPNTGLTDIPFPRAKAATVLEIRKFAKLLKKHSMDQNVKNWSKEGIKRKNPSSEKLEEVCECIGITKEQYYQQPIEFCAALASACDNTASIESILSIFNKYQNKLEAFIQANNICSGYYSAALDPLHWTEKNRVTELYKIWKGKYHLYHHATSKHKQGMVTRAILYICGTEDVGVNRYMCVSIHWAENLEYKGIIATGKNRWYFLLGSTGLHETAHIITFDPTGVGKSSMTLHGILMGCTESHPQHPTALNILIIKVDDDNVEKAKDLNSDDEAITDEIKKVISNQMKDGEYTLRSIRPDYITT